MVASFCSLLSTLPGASSKPPLLSSLSTGVDGIVPYEKFGHFENVGTNNYRYVIEDRAGLAAAVGEGIYPNERSVFKDPRFFSLKSSNELEGPLSRFSPDVDPVRAFYKWASMNGTPQKGLRLLMIGQSLEWGGQDRQALKAYYAVVVHFPKEVSWEEGKISYIGIRALDHVYRLLKEHPEWGLRLQGGRIRVKNGFDNKVTNDEFSIDPGHWVDELAVDQGSWLDDPMALRKEKLGPVKRTRGGGAVQLVQTSNGHWRLLVEGKPYLIHGICYSPTPVGVSPDFDGSRPHLDWMTSDLNHNGKADGPYDAWVDTNRDGVHDRNEKPVGDFQLMKEMGINTLRLYHHAENHELLRDLKETYGIRVMMGDFLGAYTIGSEAPWETGTDYTNNEHLAKMTESVKEMVLEHKDEPYVLMWVLGNENNYGYGNNAKGNPLAFYRFVNSLAQMVHSLDPTHPVALSNGDLDNLDMIATECPSVDVLAVNSYRGADGMGFSFWDSLREIWGKPVVIAEFGCPAYDSRTDPFTAEKEQADYLLSNWQDIITNTAGFGAGLALGGNIFEWVDEWWKEGFRTDPWIHDTVQQKRGPFPDNYLYEEWLGLMSQGDGRLSPFLRQPRLAYAQFKKNQWALNKKMKKQVGHEPRMER